MAHVGKRFGVGASLKQETAITDHLSHLWSELSAPFLKGRREWKPKQALNLEIVKLQKMPAVNSGAKQLSHQGDPGEGSFGRWQLTWLLTRWEA